MVTHGVASGTMGQAISTSGQTGGVHRGLRLGGTSTLGFVMRSTPMDPKAAPGEADMTRSNFRTTHPFWFWLIIAIVAFSVLTLALLFSGKSFQTSPPTAGTIVVALWQNHASIGGL